MLIDFAGSTAIVTELERNLRIGDKILKFMTVKTQEKITQQDIEKEMAPPAVAEAEIKGEEPSPSDQETPAAREIIEVADRESKSPASEPAGKEEE